MNDRTIHLISIIIIIFFAGSTIWWMQHSYEHDDAAEHFTQHVKDYPLLEPALPFYDKNDLTTDIEDLREYLRNIPEQNQDWADISLYFEVLNTGANTSINNDFKIMPASLAKLPIAMVAMKKVERGEWTLDSRFKLEAGDIGGDTELLAIGKEYTLKELLEAMIIKSDNSSWRVLVRNLKESEVYELGASVGLDDAFIAEDEISSKEYTRLFRTLYQATYLDYENSQYLLNLLAIDEFHNGFLHAGMPEGVKYAHKWGINNEFGVYADSGIVYAPGRPYLISVFIQAKDPKNADGNLAKAEEVMKAISEKAYNHMIK